MPAAQTPSGDADQKKKAKIFFDRARTQAEVGNHEFAIDLYLQGLAFDPANTEHMAAVARAANGAGFTATARWMEELLRRAVA